MSKFLNAAINGKDITVYGDGLQTRTFCFIDDNIEATLNCLYHNRFVNDTINLGSNLEMTILQLANLIIGCTDSNSKVLHLPALPDGDMKRRCPENSNMTQLLGRQLKPIEEGIKEVLKAHLTH